jgi:hypothetical protein
MSGQGLDPRQTARMIAQIEGTLLCEAEKRTALAAAESFASRLPWLSPDQHEEVARLYADDRLVLAHQTLRRVADRAEQLRGEYTLRYEQLRLRLVCACAAAVLAVLALALPLLGALSG